MSAPSSVSFEATASARRGAFSDKSRLRKVMMIGGVAIALGVAAYFYLTGGRYVGTDDSYIRANKLMVSTDVSGLVAEVNVHEGQTVTKGQVLFSLQKEPFQTALLTAQAAQAQAVQDAESSRASYQAAVGQMNAQRAQVRLNQLTFDRYAALAKANAIAPATVDQARGALQSSQATLLSLQSMASTALAKLNGNPNLPAEQTPAYLKAKAAADEAQRQHDHSVVRAPFDGVVSAVDSLQIGTLVISAMSAFTTTSAVGLIATKNMWIGAAMKETDLTHVYTGAPVEITVDTYPGHVWHGHVDAVGQGSDSTFSALPSENGSGNWVKVGQRFPVRIAIDEKPGDPQLRSGMSAVISIDTGYRRLWRMMNGQ